MPTFLTYAVIVLPIMAVLDGLWIGVIGKNFYKNQIGFLMKDTPNWYAAVAFYLLYACGLAMFVLLPAKSVSHALFTGAFFGLVAYATYDLTNLAVTKNWPVPVTIVDMIWGAVVSGVVAAATYAIVQKIG